MTCQSAACNAVEHLVLGQDPSDISPARRGRGSRSRGKGWGGGGQCGERGRGGGGADFEALCSLLLSSGLQGQTNVLPTQFQPY